MSWTNITKPSVGDPTTKPLIDAVIDDLGYLYNQFLSVVGNREIILNGSFESDADGDSYPDGWTRTLYTGGSFTWDNSTSAADGKAFHGKRSAKFTSPGGASNGGGYIVSESFFEVTEGRPYKVQFGIKSSVADVHNKVEISWYDCTQTLISTTTIYDEASANPTSWTLKDFWAIPPANSRYAKLTLRGCVDDDTTAGSTWFDDVRIQGYFPIYANRLTFSTAGSFQWTCPAGVYSAEITVVGAGGAGGSTNSGASGGGGGGGTAFVRRVAVTPGTIYSLTVGAGGVAPVPPSTGTGGSGGNSTMTVSGTTYTGSGGSGGTSGGSGGSGGTATNGDVNTTGTAGGANSGTTGGSGGAAAPIGSGTAGGANNNDGNTGVFGGGGSGNGGGTGDQGGNGGAGFVIIRW